MTKSGRFDLPCKSGVGADAYIGPPYKSGVGADAYIGPPCKSGVGAGSPGPHAAAQDDVTAGRGTRPLRRGC